MNGPAIGQQAPDFSLWHLDGRETSLDDTWSYPRYSIIEFGSFN
jgi:hypothetical protein